jgi:hypothetical protein
VGGPTESPPRRRYDVDQCSITGHARYGLLIESQDGEPGFVDRSYMVPAADDPGAGAAAWSHTGVCWDNSSAESFWSTFKHEYYYRHIFATKAELVAAVGKWIMRYNNQWRHSAIGMPSPVCYEQSLTGTAKAA